MVDVPTDAVHQILIKIQESIGALRSEIGQFRQETEARFENIERIMSKQRRDSAGMLVMMRATVTDFDERVSEVEERVAALEAGDH
jgi:ferritin-like metal-binding protein YciE